MTLNNGRDIRIGQRRQLVAGLLLRNPMATQRQICDELEEQGFSNPDTGQPYSLGTINADVQALRDEWRERAADDFDSFRAVQLAELREHRRMAWSAKDLGEVRLGLALEMKLLGTEAPQRHEVTGAEGGPIVIVNWEDGDDTD